MRTKNGKRISGILEIFFLASILFLSANQIVTAKTKVKVKLTVSTDYIEEGDTFTVNAAFTPATAKNQHITWSVENEDDYWFPAVKKVSGNKFKAKNAGTAIIYAYHKETKKTYKIKVIIHERLGDFDITSNGVKKTQLTTAVGSHIQVDGKLTEENDWWDETKLECTFQTENPEIAEVDSYGQLYGKSEGTTTLVVTAQNHKSKSCKVTVTKADSCELDYTYANLDDIALGGGNYSIWSNWSDCDQTYLFSLNDGNFGVFHHVEENGKQQLEFYRFNSRRELIGKKTISLPYKYFGTIYYGIDRNFYVAVGQDNQEENDAKIVYSIIKYNESFEELGRANITGQQSSTIVPFDAGSCRMDMRGTTLVVYTARLRYTSSDGLNHQSNIAFVIDSSTMNVNYVGALFPYNHVSHSFNEFVKFDGNNVIYVDHGDAYPRSVVMQTHYGFQENAISDQYESRPTVNELDLLKIKGGLGDNYTGTQVNGFEIGQYHNLVAGISVPHDTMTEKDLDTYTVQNVYLALVSKDGVTSDLQWLTNYDQNGSKTVTTLRLLKISEDQFVLLYNVYDKKTMQNTTVFRLLDSNGKVLKEKEYDICFSGYVQPILYQNGVLWMDLSSQEWNDVIHYPEDYAKDETSDPTFYKKLQNFYYISFD